EGQHQNHACPIDGLHHPFGNRAADDGLRRVENEMAAVERWNRQQVQDADADRQQGDELNQPFEAELGGLAGHAGDLHRAAQLAFVLAPDGKARQELASALDNVPGLVHRSRQRAERTVGDQPRLAQFLVVDDADDRDLDLVAERVFLLHQPGRGLDGNVLAVAQQNEGDGVAGAARHQALDVGEAVDLLAIDADEAVARLDAGLLGGAAGGHLDHHRLGYVAAIGREKHGENSDGQQEVEQRAGKHRRRALPHRLRMKGYLALGLAQLIDAFRIGGTGGDVHVADEFHVAAQRNGAEFPARAVPVVETDEFGAETDRERLNPDAAPAPDQIVAHFMDEHDYGQHEQERHQRAHHNAL